MKLIFPSLQPDQPSKAFQIGITPEDLTEALKDGREEVQRGKVTKLSNNKDRADFDEGLKIIEAALVEVIRTYQNSGTIFRQSQKDELCNEISETIEQTADKTIHSVRVIKTHINAFRSRFEANLAQNNILIKDSQNPTAFLDADLGTAEEIIENFIEPRLYQVYQNFLSILHAALISDQILDEEGNLDHKTAQLIFAASIGIKNCLLNALHILKEASFSQKPLSLEEFNDLIKNLFNLLFNNLKLQSKEDKKTAESLENFSQELLAAIENFSPANYFDTAITLKPEQNFGSIKNLNDILEITFPRLKENLALTEDGQVTIKVDYTKKELEKIKDSIHLLAKLHGATIPKNFLQAIATDINRKFNGGLTIRTVKDIQIILNQLYPTEKPVSKQPDEPARILAPTVDLSQVMNPEPEIVVDLETSHAADTGPEITVTFDEPEVLIVDTPIPPAVPEADTDTVSIPTDRPSTKKVTIISNVPSAPPSAPRSITENSPLLSLQISKFKEVIQTGNQKDLKFASQLILNVIELLENNQINDQEKLANLEKTLQKIFNKILGTDQSLRYQKLDSEMQELVFHLSSVTLPTLTHKPELKALYDAILDLNANLHLLADQIQILSNKVEKAKSLSTQQQAIQNNLNQSRTTLAANKLEHAMLITQEERTTKELQDITTTIPINLETLSAKSQALAKIREQKILANHAFQELSDQIQKLESEQTNLTVSENIVQEESALEELINLQASVKLQVDSLLTLENPSTKNPTQHNFSTLEGLPGLSKAIKFT